MCVCVCVCVCSIAYRAALVTPLDTSIRMGVRLLIVVAACGVGAVFVNAFGLIYYSSPVFLCDWGPPRDVAFKVTGGRRVYTSLVDAFRALVPRKAAPGAAAAAAAPDGGSASAASVTTAALNALRHSLTWVAVARRIWCVHAMREWLSRIGTHSTYANRYARSRYGAEKPGMEVCFKLTVANRTGREFRLNSMQLELTAGYDPLPVATARAPKDSVSVVLGFMQRFVARGMTQPVQRVMLIDIEGFDIPSRPDGTTVVDVRVTLTLVRVSV